MAQTMKDIKRRIGSVGNIMQITNAMELVSSAKLRKSRKRLEITRPYYQTVYENINEILGMNKDNTSVFLEHRPVKKRAVLVFASDRGLAGGYNINVCKEALNQLEEGLEVSFFPTGTRAVEILKRTGNKVDTSFTFINEDPVFEDAMDLGKFVLEKFENKEFDEVVAVFTKFNTVLNLEPSVIKLLPASNFERGESEVKTIDIEFEPSASAVLTQMIRQYVNVSIYGALLESSVSEQASRRTAMENATDNGQELLSDLELVYNRARQAGITQEITEIVGGAEALK